MSKHSNWYKVPSEKIQAHLPEILAFLLSLLAFLVTSRISIQVFERIPHIEDEFAILWQAEVMADGDLTQPSPDHPKSFLVPFVVDYEGQRFGKYLPGWPAALSLGARLDRSWMVNPVFASLSVWLVFRVGSLILNRWLGVLSAVFTFLSPMFLMLSGTLMSHTFSLFLTLVFSLAWFKLFSPRATGLGKKVKGNVLLVLLVGVSLGLLVLTRPLTAVGVSLPFIIHGVYLFITQDWEARLPLVGIGVVVLICALLIPVWQAALTGDPMLNPYTLWWSYDRIGFGPGTGVTEEGHNLSIAFDNLRFSLRAGVHDLFGWPYFSWLFLPFGLWALRRNKNGLIFFGIFPGLVIAYLFYWIGAWLFGPRYYYEGLPALAVTSVAGVAWIGGFIGEVAAQRWRRLLVTIFVVILILSNLSFYLPARLGGMRNLYGIQSAPLEYLKDQDLQEALIIVHSQKWMGYANLLPLVPPFNTSNVQIAWSRGEVKDAEVENSFLGDGVFHYYADEPLKLYTEPRESIP